jgi:hypothetical protein
MIRDIAQRVPVRIRLAVYDGLAIMSAASVVFGWPPEGWATRVIAFFGLLGFGLARSNVSKKEDEPNVHDV